VIVPIGIGDKKNFKRLASTIKLDDLSIFFNLLVTSANHVAVSPSTSS
jgi:hypothetical protein